MNEVKEEEIYQTDSEMDANLYMAFQGKKKPYQSKYKNERKKEVQGLETSFEERKTQLKKRQKKKKHMESKVKNASLAETQNLITEKQKDDRGIKL